MVSKSLDSVTLSTGIPGPVLIVVDTSYPSWVIDAFGTWEAVTCRDLEGYFAHVLTVNPLSSVVSTPSGEEVALPLVTEISPRHTFVDGSHQSTKGPLRKPGLAALGFPVEQIRLLAWVARWASDKNVLAVRAGDPLYSGLFGYVLSRILHVALVVRVGGNNERLRRELGHALMPRLLRSRRLEQWIEGFVFRRAMAVLPANLDYQNFAVDSGAPLERCTIIRYGNLLDGCHFVAPEARNEGKSLLQACGVPEDAPVLLYVGRLSRLKSSMDVISVCSTLKKRGLIFRCLMVGEGSEQEEIRAAIRRYDLDDVVHLCGSRSQEWLSRVLPEVSVFVSPLAGRALTEAALAGAPVAAYDVDWQAEIVIDGETGLLAPFQDSQALAEQVERLLLSRTEAQRLGAALRARAMMMMNPQALNAAERAVYTSLHDDRVDPAKAR